MSTEDLRRRRRRADSNNEDSDSEEDRVIGSNDDDEGVSAEALDKRLQIYPELTKVARLIDRNLQGLKKARSLRCYNTDDICMYSVPK